MYYEGLDTDEDDEGGFWKTRKMSWIVGGLCCRDHLIYKGLGVLYKCLITVWAPGP